MLTYILNRPLKNDKLVESIKKNQQFIEHDINSLLQLVYFYEQIVLNFNINNGISKIWNELENKYSLTLTKNGLSSILELHTIKVQIERIYDMLYLKNQEIKILI